MWGARSRGRSFECSHNYFVHLFASAILKGMILKIACSQHLICRHFASTLMSLHYNSKKMSIISVVTIYFKRG
jgi:hypothetical protein